MKIMSLRHDLSVTDKRISFRDVAVSVKVTCSW